MAQWSKVKFERDLRELVKQSEEVGIEKAVGAFAASVLADYPPETVQAYATSLQAKHRIKGDDAISASRVYQAHITSAFPWFVRALWPVLKRIVPDWFVESGSECVVLRTPYANGRVLCPVVRAVDGDLAKARPICEALVRHDIFAEPMSTLVAKAVNPRLRWEIHEYRDRPEFPCYYALVLEP